MYKPINGFTKAKIIETIQTRMLDHRSIVKDKSGHFLCAYRAGDGNRCAIGVFIPDGHNGEMHNGRVDNLLTKYPDLRQNMPLEDDALDRLQLIHDKYYTPNDNLAGDPRPDLIEWINENVRDTNELHYSQWNAAYHYI